MASIVGHYAFLVAVSVYAYDVGGEKAVGLVFLVRLIPAALVAPFAACSVTATRASASSCSRTSRASCSSVRPPSACSLDADPYVIYALAIAATIANTPFRSSQAALTPTLARARPRSSRPRTRSRAESKASRSSPDRPSPAFSSASRAPPPCSRSPRCWSSFPRYSSSSSACNIPNARARELNAGDDRRRASRGVHDAGPGPLPPRDDGAADRADDDRSVLFKSSSSSLPSTCSISATAASATSMRRSASERSSERSERCRSPAQSG